MINKKLYEQTKIKHYWFLHKQNITIQILSNIAIFKTVDKLQLCSLKGTFCRCEVYYGQC